MSPVPDHHSLGAYLPSMMTSKSRILGNARSAGELLHRRRLICSLKCGHRRLPQIAADNRGSPQVSAHPRLLRAWIEEQDQS